MTPTAAADLDGCVEAFERAWGAGPPPLAPFLPPPDHPERPAVLAELVRVDLEFRAGRGEPARVGRYLEEFPSLLNDPECAREVVFEEYRLRLAAGEQPDPAEYAARYRLDTAGWPRPPAPDSPGAPASRTAVTAIAGAAGGPAGFPEPGELVLDFRLVRELGRGSFGRVYLAEQGGLAGRPVAVKVTTRPDAAESATLARLQHAHIVPVHSVHRAGNLHLLVMPYFGGTTLADLLGALRERGAWPSTGKELADTLSGRLGTTVGPGAGAAPDGAPAPKPGVAVAGLARFTYPEAVLWLGARLAEALAHAHERGVLHRDIKPANVLLADDGRPMLLDFNLAGAAGGNSGGTPAYMAPEQLRAMRGPGPLGGGAVGPTADLYALGLVLFELLAGRSPSPPPRGAPDPIGALLAARSAAPPRLRPLAPAVTPSAEAIILRCLDPDPARRYPSAEALADDLTRQLDGRPLAHAREPSARERLRKWRRRNPRLSAAMLALTVAILVSAAAAREVGRHRLAQARAAGAEFALVKPAVPGAIAALSLHPADPARRAEGLTALAALEGLARPDLLSETDRAERDGGAAELLWLAAGAEPEPLAALELSGRALKLAPAAPRWRLRERAAWAARAGRPAEVAGALVAAAATPPDGRDDYYEGLRLLRAHDPEGAAKCLEAATAAEPPADADADPGAYSWWWLALGEAYTRLGRAAEAEWANRTAVALAPGHAVARQSLGLARLRQGKHDAAEADFSAALGLGRGHGRAGALAGRAQARLALGRVAEAAADFDAALDADPADTRLYFARSDARRQSGDAAGADADRRAGLALPPSDEAGWVARGLARLAADPAGAVADFDAALALNPRSYPALAGKSQALDEGLRRPADSLAVVNQLVEFYPRETAARAGRAVLLARKGERAGAHADAERCLADGPRPFERYQLAGVYALTSRTHPADAPECFRLLEGALRAGAGFEFVDDPKADPDLDPVRGRPEFRRIVAAAQLDRPPTKKERR